MNPRGRRTAAASSAYTRSKRQMAFAFIFGDVGVGEWVVLLAVVLVVFGPKRLPDAARKMGIWYSRARRAAESFRRQLLEMEADVERAADSAEHSAVKAFTVVPDSGKAVPVKSSEGGVNGDIG